MIDSSAWLAAIAALAAAVAAVASLLQVRSASHSNEINAYLSLMESYAAPQMRAAISRLAEFWRDRRDKFGDAGEAFVAEPDAALRESLKADCRLLTAFFGNAARLYDARLISRKLVLTLISRPGLNIYYDVCEPINIRRNPKGHSSKYGVILRRVVTKYADGTY